MTTTTEQFCPKCKKKVWFELTDGRKNNKFVCSVCGLKVSVPSRMSRRYPLVYYFSGCKKTVH